VKLTHSDVPVVIQSPMSSVAGEGSVSPGWDVAIA